MYNLDEIKSIPITKFLTGEKQKTPNGYIYKLCPFCHHKEHLFVNTANNTYKSFNSCVGGNTVIDFIINLKGLEFKEAIKYLADEENIKNNVPAKSKKEIEINYVFGLLEKIRLDNMIIEFFKELKEKKLDQVFEKAFILEKEKLIHFIFNYKIDPDK